MKKNLAIKVTVESSLVSVFLFSLFFFLYDENLITLYQKQERIKNIPYVDSMTNKSFNK